MKHVLSVSLGSARRDKTAEIEVLGERFLLERRGTDGSLERFERFLTAGDGVVDCLCVGGTNLALHCAGRCYRLRGMCRLTCKVRTTAIVDGSGLKNTLERKTIQILQERGLVDFARAKVLLPCAIDRFGMAETVSGLCSSVVYGDAMFSLHVPIALHSLRTLQGLGRALLPLIVRLPFRWLHAAGAGQDRIVPRYHRWYRWADVIAGDFVTIRRHMPEDLSGKIIITNSTTQQDVTDLRNRGVRLLVTSTPVVEGRAFATNVMEGVFVCLLGKRPHEIRPEEYFELAERMHWEPTIRDLTVSDGE